ncbi:MAG: tRNA preQ1(34) S-adenosylmethionine ribosyltransferase-isomerase QueA [Rhodospirillales bacterium]|jgi:S-adenosylmethionine:tRNA ribosyltransferase-isomerase|nr:tRNA preQ1(34) S-adenosylmethionine ribosyltransferase-isomerase QueA [Rhodospirillales bacterium]HJO96825.1 tRNA preQ1(34) S-adenosylmethionine ribosyltransferase-isomerase QueA [Rhodospirillales bacterium]
MKVDTFDFDLPRACIAQRPMTPRDAARLLVVGDELRDARVSDLPRHLSPGDLLVFNDTKVIPARLAGRRGAAKVEVTLHKAADAATWRAFARPARRLKKGDRIEFAPGFVAEVETKGEAGEVTLSFEYGSADLEAALERFGAMPLPPYIKRPNLADWRDPGDYQTMFARVPGAVAAPTAGLHFTPGLLDGLDARGVERIALTLHVGAGTFLPVKVEDVADHKMHAEWGEITALAAAAVNAARARGNQVVAVGSTALRLLEAATDAAGRLRPFAGETDIFITPGYRFRTVDRLLTNFHLPRSTLFMLVSAFAGTRRMKHAYAHAKDTGYRFYSYGDACLLSRSEVP